MTANNGESKVSCSRWVRQCVDIYDHPVLDHGPYDRRSAWGWLIANAAWKDREVNHKGKRITLKRGQLIGARAFLADKWGWSEQQVRTFVNHLVREGMLEINQSGGHYANVISVCNYDAYQFAPDPQNRNDNQSLTSVQPEPNQTLKKEYNINSGCDTRESADDLAIDRKSIRHDNFTISLDAIVLGTMSTGWKPEDVHRECEVHARQWAAEIAGGKLSRDVLPQKIANFLCSSIVSKANKAVCASASRERSGHVQHRPPSRAARSEEFAGLLAAGGRS